MKKPQYIFIHHTAVSRQKNPDQWKATNEYHRTKNWGTEAKPLYTPISSLGFYGGYNYEISANGSIHQFRKDGEVTVAQYQQNMNDGRAISICLDLNGDIETPTAEQKKAVSQLLLEKMNKYGIAAKNVFCHRSVADYKSCPGVLLPNNILNYFLSNISMADGTPQLTEWAKEAWEWGIAQEFISKNSVPTIDMQRTMLVLYRYDKKNQELLKKSN